MTESNNLPSGQCPSCKYYIFRGEMSLPHRCKKDTSWGCGGKPDPDRTGTGNCRLYEPK